MTLKENNSSRSFIMKLEHFKYFCLTNRLKIYLFLLVVFLFVQFFFWTKIVNVRAYLDVVDAPPSSGTIKAFSFGDSEYYFRLKLFKVQNMGDTYGRFTSLSKYDYKKLYEWFILLENLNEKSTYLPSLVAYYYSQTPKVEDRIYTIKFLERHALLNPEKNWWWLYQAMYIAFFSMKDENLGVDLAYKLKKYSPATAPIWTKQMVAILLAKKGNECEAVRVISEILNDYEKNSSKSEKEKNDEMNYMKYFINTNIEMLKEKNININDCFK